MFFADLGLEDAPELNLKAAIVGQINSILRHRHLTQVQAAELLDLPQPKISALKNGKLRGFSLEKLLEIMVKLVLWNPWLLRQKGAAAQHRKLRGSGGGGVVRSLVSQDRGRV